MPAGDFRLKSPFDQRGGTALRGNQYDALNVTDENYAMSECHRRLASCPKWSVCINGLQSEVLVRLAEGKILAPRRRRVCHTVCFSHYNGTFF